MSSKLYIVLLLTALLPLSAVAETIESIKFGDMEHWVTRNIKESRVIGGKQKQVYAIGPTATVNGDKPYVPAGGSPWATSNVMAKVAGITKTSNSVYPAERPGGGKACQMRSEMEQCKALGIINIDVMVAGSVFLGRMLEPIKSTSDPYAKMEMGIPFTRHPEALVYDYELVVPLEDTRVYSSGFGKKKTLKGREQAEVVVMLQRRWEDADGNIYAKRVATGRERLAKDSGGWVNHHHLPLHYGDISHEAFYKPYMKLLRGDNRFYARNSKGKMVPVTEVGWDAADATPTHLIVQFAAASGEPYVGTPGLTFTIDNVSLAYK